MNDSPANPVKRSAKAAAWLWLTCGAALVLAMVVAALMSPRLIEYFPPEAQPIVPYFALLLGAAVMWCIWLVVVGPVTASRSALMWIIVVGVMMRAMAWISSPILEGDHYRYLWDGAVTANGHNPYVHPPDALTDTPLQTLAADAQQVITRINHPHLATIYPPTAQAAFALGYWIAPFDAAGLRIVWHVFDIAVALLIVLLLIQLGRPPTWVVIWWCNPLVVIQIAFGLHMDVVVAAFALLAVYFAVRRWYVITAAALALAVGAKVWPIVLLPLLMRGAGWRRGASGWAAFGVIGGLLAWPILAAGLGDTSGFAAYSRSWANNAGAFALIESAWHALFGLAGVESLEAGSIARFTSTAMCGLIALFMAARPSSNGATLVSRATLITAMVFMLSPTQFPWYYVWLVPLLAVSPRWSLLIYTPLLSLYYLQGHWEHVVWLEHGPVWLLLISEFVLRRPRWGATCTSR